MVAAGRGCRTGPADRVYPVGVPEPVIGVDVTAEAAAPVGGLSCHRNDDNGRRQQNDNYCCQHPDDLIRGHAAVVVIGGHGGIGGKGCGVRHRDRHMHIGGLAMLQRAEIPGQVLAVNAGVIGHKAIVIAPAHLHILNAQIIEPAGREVEGCRAVIIFCKQMALVYAERKTDAALAAVLCRYSGGVVALGKHDLGIAAAVIGILQIVDRIGQRGHLVHAGIGQPNLDPAQIVGLIAVNDLPVDVVGDVGRAVLPRIDIAADIIHIAVLGAGGLGLGRRSGQGQQRAAGQHGT